MLAMCWKCTHQITEEDVSGAFSRLIGCKACEQVTDFNTAQKYCPVTKELLARKYKTVPLQIPKADPP